MEEGSTSDAPFSLARVEMKAFCFSVGASAPVAHWEGLSSWDVILGGDRVEWQWVVLQATWLRSVSMSKSELEV